MDCPECKVKLIRRRTLDQVTQVERENKCPECNKNYPSIEMLKKDMDDKIATYSDMASQHRKERDEIKNNYLKLINAIGVIKEAFEDGKRLSTEQI